MNTYNIGRRTMDFVFRKSGLTNVSDWQAVLDAVEDALEPSEIAAKFIDKHRVSCMEATASDGIYEEAPILVEELADCVGYYEYPEDDD